MSDVIGIDVSLWQDNNSTPQMMNFEKAKEAGARFVFIKASQATFIDQDFVMNWQNAKRSGLPRGAYHYMDWTRRARDQAIFFANVLKNDAGELPVVLDYECRKNAPSRNIAVEAMDEFIYTLEKNVDNDVMIYTSPSFWREYGSANSKYQKHKLWIANYGVAKPSVPVPWSKWTFWQYTDKGDGRAFGAESYSIDMNRYNGTQEDFDIEFGEQEPPVIPPEPEDCLWRYEVITDRLNIRACPSTSCADIGDLHKGDIVKVDDVNSPQEYWVKIRLDDGTVGWCAAKHQGNPLMQKVA